MYGGSTCGKAECKGYTKDECSDIYGKNVKGLWPGGCTGGWFVETVSLWLGGVRHTA